MSEPIIKTWSCQKCSSTNNLQREYGYPIITANIYCNNCIQKFVSAKEKGWYVPLIYNLDGSIKVHNS